MNTAIQELEKMSKSGKPFLIVGKGRSFKPDFKDFDKYNVLSINDTMYYAKNSIGLYSIAFNDFQVLASIHIDGVNKMFCPSHAASGALKKTTDISFLMDVVTNFQNKKIPNIYTFNYNQNSFYNQELGPIIHAYNSTYESTIWLLAHAGVKNVFTMGIDFDQEHHPIFGLPPSPVPYAAMKYYAQVAIDYYKMNVQPLSDGRGS